MSLLDGLRRVLEQELPPCALVGGLAVSVYAEPRFTRDVDLAVEEARQALRLITERGYDRGRDLLAELAAL